MVLLGVSAYFYNAVITGGNDTVVQRVFHQRLQDKPRDLAGEYIFLQFIFIMKNIREADFLQLQIVFDDMDLGGEGDDLISLAQAFPIIFGQRNDQI